MPCKSEKNIVIHAPPQEVFNYLCDTLKVSKFKIKYIDMSNAVIILRSPMSFWSWGENISVQVYVNPDMTTLVRIYSEPIVPTTLIDYGRNKNNTKKIVEPLFSYFQGRILQQY